MTTLSRIGITFVEEVADLMRSNAASASARHVLLRPKNLGVATRNHLPEWVRDRFDLQQFEEEDEFLFWDSLEPEEVNSGETWPAFWQLLGMTEADGSEVKAFTERWGMLSGDWDGYTHGDRFDFDRREAMDVGVWHDFARSARALLALVVLTVEDEIVGSDLLEVIQHWDELPDWPPMVDNIENLNQEEMDRYVNQIREAPFVRSRMRWDTLIAERARGEALKQQRRIAVNALNYLLGMQYARFGWDDGGRRMEREAFGLDDVVFSHIATIFSSHELDVLICSICGKPYPFDEAGSGRRPRYGVRRFCSDVCRQTGKRESNRMSWHRNSMRWRRDPSTKRTTKEKPNGT